MIYFFICKMCASHECTVQFVPLSVFSVDDSYIFYNILSEGFICLPCSVASF